MTQAAGTPPAMTEGKFAAHGRNRRAPFITVRRYGPIRSRMAGGQAPARHGPYLALTRRASARRSRGTTAAASRSFADRKSTMSSSVMIP